MKEKFFKKVLNISENRPFLTTVTREWLGSQTIAQTRKGEHDELAVVLQEGADPLAGPDNVETTITLQNSQYGEPFGMMVNQGFANSLGGRTVPMYPNQACPRSNLFGKPLLVLAGVIIHEATEGIRRCGF